MSIVRVGTTKRYADNWENIFGGGSRGNTKKAAKTATPARSSAKKKPAKKKAAKKPSRRK